jgi:hypothetical protein
MVFRVIVHADEAISGYNFQALSGPDFPDLRQPERM